MELQTAGIVLRITFGAFAVVLGCAIICWICYNEFVHRLPQYTGFHWWEPFGIAPALVSVGIYWLRNLKQGSAGRNRSR